MKKMNLTEQLQQLLSEEWRIKENHLRQFWSVNKEPQQLFQVSRIGIISEIALKGSHIGYRNDRGNLWPPSYNKDKRPSRNLVLAYFEYVESLKTVEQIIYIEYVTSTGYGCYNYNELIEKAHFAFKESDLQEEAMRLKELYGPKENHTACGYCGKQTPNDKLFHSTIIGRGRKQVWNSWKSKYESKACITNEPMKFCSGICAGNEQMSREG